MRILCLQHVPYEGPGSISDWARRRGHTLVEVLVPAAGPLPAPGAYDWLIVMGGPMGVHDVDRHPWLRGEKRALRAALDAGRRVLGICLGAQLLAEALGAGVRRNTEREIGWFTIRRAPEAPGSALGRALPEDFSVLHWHSDTFDLPPGAIHLASSDACARQAFAIGDQVAGLQFHLEMTVEGARAIVAHDSADLAAGPFVQRADELLRDPDRFARANRLLDDLLDRMASSGTGPARRLRSLAAR
jgi:GMP synthase-like glutamine amidotransferase